MKWVIFMNIDSSQPRISRILGVSPDSEKKKVPFLKGPPVASSFQHLHTCRSALRTFVPHNCLAEDEESKGVTFFYKKKKKPLVRIWSGHQAIMPQSYDDFLLFFFLFFLNFSPVPGFGWCLERKKRKTEDPVGHNLPLTRWNLSWPRLVRVQWSLQAKFPIWLPWKKWDFSHAASIRFQDVNTTNTALRSWWRFSNFFEGVLLLLVQLTFFAPMRIVRRTDHQTRNTCSTSLGGEEAFCHHGTSSWCWN